MPRPMHKLSARAVATTTTPGRYGDGAGLYLRVTDAGAKRWVFRYTEPVVGVIREMGLGSAGPQGVPLARARVLAGAARDVVASGGDPIAAQRAVESPPQATPTFGAFADEFVEAQAAGFRNRKHIDQWKMTLATYAAALRPLAIDNISTDEVVAVLKPIWQTKSETASRLRGRIERVLDAAKARGLRSGENPARWRGHLSLLLSKRQKLTRGHHRALDYKNVPAFLRELQLRNGSARWALEFLILTAARSGEVRHATWDEIDRDSKMWTIPAERMKAGRIHRVPLTERMVAILDAVGDGSHTTNIFGGSRLGRPLTDAALSNLLKRMGVFNATVHGFRSAFRDWVGDATDAPREVAEAALAHAVGDATERAYRRNDAFEKRRLLMEAWGQFCLG